jgi:hypothetical protein
MITREGKADEQANPLKHRFVQGEVMPRDAAFPNGVAKKKAARCGFFPNGQSLAPLTSAR